MTNKRGEMRSGKSRKLAGLVGGLLSPALRRRGFAETEVISRWPRIVGPELAAHCLPERLTFPHRDFSGGTLHLRVDGAFAVELQHLEPVMIDRINTFYGYRAVGRLRITQAPIPRRPQTTGPETLEVDPVSAASIDRVVAETRDQGLKESLAALGRSIFSQASRGGGGDRSQ